MLFDPAIVVVHNGRPSMLRAVRYPAGESMRMAIPQRPSSRGEREGTFMHFECDSAWRTRWERVSSWVGRCLSAGLLSLIALPAQAGAAPGVPSEKVKAALAPLERLTEQTLKETGVPGLAIAVVHRDRVVYLKGFGVRQAGKPEAV